MSGFRPGVVRRFKDAVTYSIALHGMQQNKQLLLIRVSDQRYFDARKEKELRLLFEDLRNTIWL